jgi:bacterial/archaeal transporter family-2 protein
MNNPPTQHRPLHLIAAFATGGLLTMMVYLNGELARYGNAVFSSWSAHGTGTVTALVLLALLYRRNREGAALRARAPTWAYLGGLSGAATVVLTSQAVNSPLALSGTLALGLAGQVTFSLAADRWGLFGLPVRRLDRHDFIALALILAGSMLIILVGRGGE